MAFPAKFMTRILRACTGEVDPENREEILEEFRYRGSEGVEGAEDVLADYGLEDDCVSRLKEENIAFLHAHWPDVEAVAGALLDRKTLTGEEVREVILSRRL